MAIKLTPEKARFFLFASVASPGQGAQSTLLQTLLSFPLHPTLRYRLNVLRRNLESSLRPFDEQAKELYDAYVMSTTEESEGEPAAAATTGRRKKAAEPTSQDGDGVDEGGSAQDEAKKKFEDDIAELSKTEFDFTGKLIPVSLLDGLPEESFDFFAIPGVMEDWLMPFVQE